MRYFLLHTLFISLFACHAQTYTIEVLVEIPAGTSEKWELNKDSGQLEWEEVDGEPRIVQYLPYPANYGLIPNTLLPREDGGDGDPLDVILLGPAQKRGSRINARLIGVMHLKDDGEKDDKLLAVADNSPFTEVESLAQLRKEFPQITEILSLWFSNYTRGTAMQVTGFSEADLAVEILKEAQSAYQKETQQ